jgi:hypothetical protein
MLDREEAIAILEEIARNAKNQAARIAAIKQLEDMKRGEELPQGDFAALDQVGLRRQRRRAS